MQNSQLLKSQLVKSIKQPLHSISSQSARNTYHENNFDKTLPRAKTAHNINCVNENDMDQQNNDEIYHFQNQFENNTNDPNIQAYLKNYKKQNALSQEELTQQSLKASQPINSLPNNEDNPNPNSSENGEENYEMFSKSANSLIRFSPTNIQIDQNDQLAEYIDPTINADEILSKKPFLVGENEQIQLQNEDETSNKVENPDEIVQQQEQNIAQIDQNLSEIGAEIKQNSLLNVLERQLYIGISEDEAKKANIQNPTAWEMNEILEVQQMNVVKMEEVECEKVSYLDALVGALEAVGRGGEE